jgi:hypothetical protein
VPKKGPLIVAGDFNDWQKKASDYLRPSWALRGVRARRGPARASYPAQMPFFTLDRIYVRDLGSTASSATWARRGRGSPTTSRLARASSSRASDSLRCWRRRRAPWCPTPELVSTSSSSACDTRPSMMCALFTPFLTASSAHSDLGQHAAEIVPSVDHLVHLLRGEAGDDLAFLVEHAAWCW